MPTIIYKIFKSSSSNHDMVLHVQVFVVILFDRTFYHMLSHQHCIMGDFILLCFKRMILNFLGWEHSPHLFHNWRLQLYTSPCFNLRMMNLRISTSSIAVIHEVFLHTPYQHLLHSQNIDIFHSQHNVKLAIHTKRMQRRRIKEKELREKGWVKNREKELLIICIINVTYNEGSNLFIFSAT